MTSLDKIYRVVHCKEIQEGKGPRGKEGWYLLDTSRNWFWTIEGIVSNNDSKSQPKKETDQSYWSPKIWQGYQATRSRGKQRVEKPFQILFNSNVTPFKFPFFQALDSKCMSKKDSQGVVFGACQDLEIPTWELKKGFSQQILRETSEIEKLCFSEWTNEASRKTYWKTATCSPSILN